MVCYDIVKTIDVVVKLIRCKNNGKNLFFNLRVVLFSGV